MDGIKYTTSTGMYDFNANYIRAHGKKCIRVVEKLPYVESPSSSLSLPSSVNQEVTLLSSSALTPPFLPHPVGGVVEGPLVLITLDVCSLSISNWSMISVSAMNMMSLKYLNIKCHLQSF
jgi:hypothetical protein